MLGCLPAGLPEPALTPCSLVQGTTLLLRMMQGHAEEHDESWKQASPTCKPVAACVEAHTPQVPCLTSQLLCAVQYGTAFEPDRWFDEQGAIRKPPASFQVSSAASAPAQDFSDRAPEAVSPVQPFGAGPRMCLGWRLAKLEGKVSCCRGNSALLLRAYQHACWTALRCAASAWRVLPADSARWRRSFWRCWRDTAGGRTWSPVKSSLSQSQVGLGAGGSPSVGVHRPLILLLQGTMMTSCSPSSGTLRSRCCDTGQPDSCRWLRRRQLAHLFCCSGARQHAD